MENIWLGILALRETINNFNADINFCWLNLSNQQVFVNKTIEKNTAIGIQCKETKIPNPKNQAIFKLSNSGNIISLHSGNLNQETLLFLQKYLPYCFLSIKAKNEKRAICVSHFAQTLDAKIATQSGDSKWIGNSENLIHAHRMRALCNGVLVGSRTVENDQPKLNVRHVSGKNPVKIVLGNPNSDFKSLLESSDEKILVFGKEKILTSPSIISYPLPYLADQKFIAPKLILEKLFELGVYAIYIEGGANTTSLFLNAKAVDILQLHLAPIIFGSGKTSITLPNIDLVKEAISFPEYHFLPFGNSVMFTGFLKA